MIRCLHRDDSSEVGLGDRFCVFRLAVPHQSIGFAVLEGGLSTTRTVTIHEIRNEELGPDVDAVDVARRLQASRVGEAGVALLTSRRLDDVDVATASDADAAATALATVGLGNALRIGDSAGPIELPGTINLVVRSSVPMTIEARLEALTLLAEARTAAVLEARFPSMRSGRAATGTGTDAIVLLTPFGDSPAAYAGKHTSIGAAVGAAAYRAVRAGVDRWRREIEPTLPTSRRTAEP